MSLLDVEGFDTWWGRRFLNAASASRVPGFCVRAVRAKGECKTVLYSAPMYYDVIKHFLSPEEAYKKKGEISSYIANISLRVKDLLHSLSKSTSMC